MNLRIFGSLLILSLIFTSGCLDLEFIYHTKINKDGSLIRKAQATGDSSDIYENPFPFILDTSWLTSYSQTMRDTDSVYMVQVERAFNNAEGLNAVYSILTDSSQTEPISVNLDHSFRWFYTFSTWTERMPQRFPFYKLSVDSFLTEDELNFWMYSDSSLFRKYPEKNEAELGKEVHDLASEFIEKAIFEDFYEIILPVADEKGLADKLNSDKEILFKKLKLHLLESSIDSIYIETDRHFNRPICETLKDKSELHFFAYKVDQFMDNLIATQDFTYFLEFPGMIVGGNAMIDSNDIASWKFKSGDHQFHDYEMNLEYRTPNYWTFVVTATVLLFLLWFIVRSGKRSESQI